MRVYWINNDKSRDEDDAETTGGTNSGDSMPPEGWCDDQRLVNDDINTGEESD